MSAQSEQSSIQFERPQGSPGFQGVLIDRRYDMYQVEDKAGNEIKGVLLNDSFIAAGSNYTRIAELLKNAEQKLEQGEQKRVPASASADAPTEPTQQPDSDIASPTLDYFPVLPTILPDSHLFVGKYKESAQGCQQKWDIRCSDSCWLWFFNVVEQQKGMVKGSPAWRQLLQYATEHVFAGIFAKLPEDFFVIEDKGVSRDRAIGLSLADLSKLPKSLIITEMTSLIENLAEGFREELHKEKARKKNMQFFYWNSLTAALLATLIMALLAASIGDAAAMAVLLAAFYGAPLLCLATFAISFAVAEMVSFFVPPIKIAALQDLTVKRVVTFCRHAFLCAVLCTLTAIALLMMESATPGVSILVAMLPSTGGLLIAGGPSLVAFCAFLLGVGLIGSGYLLAMGWRWWRGTAADWAKAKIVTDADLDKALQPPQGLQKFDFALSSSAFADLHAQCRASSVEARALVLRPAKKDEAQTQTFAP